MNKFTKFLIAWLIFGLVSIIAGQYLGSLAYNQFGSLSVPAGITTLYQLYSVSSGQLLSSKAYIFALAVSFLPFVFITALLIYGAVAKPKRELHGSAKFATSVDIQKANLLKTKYKEPDILIGQHKGKYLRWPGNEFVALAAPTRSGKGVGLVIPNCLHYRDSLVVFDPKLENFEITAGYRKACGQEVYLYNPSSDEFKSHRWNPLHYVSRNPNRMHSGMAEVASILLATSDEGNAQFWSGMAQQLFVGLGLYLIEKEDESGVTPTISEILRLAQPKDQELNKWIDVVVLDPTLSDNCKSGLLSYSRNSTNTASSILSSLIEPLSIFNDPVVAEVTSGNDFDFRDIRKKRMTIYLGINLADLASGRFNRLNNLFFSQLIYQNLRELPKDNKALKYQCLLLLDEFTSLGNMAVLEKGVAYVAGYNMRILLCYQNNAQLNAAYTENGARSLLTNIKCQIMYTPADIEDAEEYSKTIGYETYKSRSQSVGGKSGGGGTISPSQRALLLPQELLVFPTDECIVKIRGTKTIHADKIIYYKDPNFIKRLAYDVPNIPYTPKGLEEIAKANQAQKDEKHSLDNIKDFLRDLLVQPTDPLDYRMAVNEQVNKVIDFNNMDLIDALDSILKGENIDLLTNAA